MIADFIRNRRLLLAATALVPPGLFFVYQLARELTGALQAPIEIVGGSVFGLALLAAIAVFLPALAIVLGALAARRRHTRWPGLALAAGGVLLLLANVAARAS